MITVLQVVMQLIDLNTSLIFESLLIVIDDVKLVFVVLKERASMIDKVSHIALQI